MASEVTVSEQEPAWQAGAQAMEVLAPEMGLLARLDPADFGVSVLTALTRAAGRPAEAGRAWHGNPAYFTLRQAYLATRRLGEELLAAGRGDPLVDQKAGLAVGFAFDALAPTNFLAG